jgi:predicted RNA-binding Zn-ribbon protein involved in translation (DUF1610 family)
MDRDRDRSESKPKPKPKDKEMTFGPRTIQMAPTRNLSRCAQCGVVLSSLVDPAGACPKCGAALHACKQCPHFDPGSRFECRQPVTVRVANKVNANDCRFFSLSTRVERETSSSPLSSDDARRAFENLFRK